MTTFRNKPGRVTVSQINELMMDHDMMDADWPVCQKCKLRLDHMDLLDHRFPYEQGKNLCQDCEEKAAAAKPLGHGIQLPNSGWGAKRPPREDDNGPDKPNAPTTGPFPRPTDQII